MKEALDFIHKHNICHNDISDKNIVAKNGKPVLVDFGNAATVNDQQVGFHGTTEYTHRKVHRAYTTGAWNCQKHYDWTSLGFTMATILNGGIVAWMGFSSGPVQKQSSDVFDDRIKCAQNIVADKIAKSECETNLTDLSDLILSWIKLDLFET